MKSLHAGIISLGVETSHLFATKITSSTSFARNILRTGARKLFFAAAASLYLYCAQNNPPAAKYFANINTSLSSFHAK